MIRTDLSAMSAPAPFDVGVVLLVFAGIVLFGAAMRLIVLRLRQHEHERERELPPLVYPAPHDGRGSEVSRPPRPASGDHVTFSAASGVRAVRDESSARAPSVPRLDSSPEREGPAVVDSDATLHLLPGRLEPVNAGAGEEIRFVKVAGVTRFTLGRRAGPAHSHIQLRSATASRMHAFMEFEHGRWQLVNLSSTNRVLVNGLPLMGEAARVLEDGDRIEFGELKFVFRER